MAAELSEREAQAFPRLDEQQLERMARCGRRLRVEAGEILWRQGERNTRFFVVVSGVLEIVQANELGRDHPVAMHGPGEFTGEVDLLLGRPSVVAGRMREAGELIALDRVQLRQLVSSDADLSELLMRAFILRRAILIARRLGDVVLVGSQHSASTLRLREFLTRNGHPYAWLDVETDPGVRELLDHFGVQTSETPVVICRGAKVLRNPSVDGLARCLGLSVVLDPRAVHDVVVIGAGPAGLAAAVYAASEGLDVLVLEAEAPGGQAGSSSKIENYLGFPTGISGQALASRAFAQAAKFGASVSVAQPAARLDCSHRPYAITVDGAAVPARVVVIACGARYRKLPLAELDRFEGAGIYYAATHVEAQLCRGEDVIVVGGGNSAGQAAVFLSQRVRRVHMLVRAAGLSESMSRYLISRIEESPKINLLTRTELVALEGRDWLERVRWRRGETGAVEERAIRHVFVMTGADPNTRWLDGGLRLDERGFVKTGADLRRDELTAAAWPLARPPYLLEASLPAVFAVGDVRSGSVKRVAAAVGEGSTCVQLIHRVLRE